MTDKMTDKIKEGKFLPFKKLAKNDKKKFTPFYLSTGDPI